MCIRDSDGDRRNTILIGNSLDANSDDEIQIGSNTITDARVGAYNLDNLLPKNAPNVSVTTVANSTFNTTLALEVGDVVIMSMTSSSGSTIPRWGYTTTDLGTLEFDSLLPSSVVNTFTLHTGSFDILTVTASGTLTTLGSGQSSTTITAIRMRP